MGVLQSSGQWIVLLLPLNTVLYLVYIFPLKAGIFSGVFVLFVLCSVIASPEKASLMMTTPYLMLLYNIMYLSLAVVIIVSFLCFTFIYLHI